MKKILSLSCMLILLSAAALAQRGPGDRASNYRVIPSVGNGQLTRPERFELGKDQFRYKIAQRNARRDGMITPFEKRRLHKIKCNNRRDAFRFKHNSRRRII